MVANIDEQIKICGLNIHIHSISTTYDSHGEKTYYQHRHPGIEIHYVMQGQCKATCNKHSFSIPTHSILLIPPGTYHDVSSAQNNTIRFCLSFTIQKSNQEAITPNAAKLIRVFSCDMPVIAQLENTDAQQILQQLILRLEDTKDDLFKNDKLLTQCGSLLLELVPHLDTATTYSTSSKTDAVQDDISFKIDSFLGLNFMRNDAKEQMAEDLYVSPRQLQRIIRKNYGMSYRQKLAETRLQIAIDLLHNSDMSINQISEILGYSCSANFSAFLKRETGKTPSQVRKER